MSLIIIKVRSKQVDKETKSKEIYICRGLIFGNEMLLT